MLGRVGSGTVELDETHRFRSGAIRLSDGLYWDVLGLYQNIMIGSGRRLGPLDSGADGWPGWRSTPRQGPRCRSTGSATPLADLSTAA
jgi:hypothetical protein